MPILLERKIAAGYAVAVVFLLLVGGTAWWSATRSAETFRLVDHTHQVLYQLEASLTDMLNMQTATRGFLLTGKESFLAPFVTGTSRIDKNLQRLHGLTRDNPVQQEHLARLEVSMTRSLDLMRDRIAQKRGGNFAADTEIIALEAGKTSIAEVRAIILRMENIERQLLAARTADAQSGQRQAVLVFGLGTLLAAGLVVGAGLVVRRDFHQRVKAEAERDRFFSLSLDLLCISSGDGYFKRVSPAVTDILGWTVGEFLARPYLERIHPDDRAASLREVERQLIGGHKVLQFENRFQHKDGSWRVLSWRSVPQPDGLMYAIARDVTERRQRDEQVRRLHADLQLRAAQLEVANKELESFSYSVSHDLRAPLRHIDGFTGLLRKHAAAVLDDQGRRYLDTISGAARQMGRLIDDLLSFSRMGRANVQPVEVDQDALVAAIIHEGGLTKAPRPVEWLVAPLPRVRADPTMLRQVWFNLLDNAVKYSGKTPAPRIEVGHHRDAGTCEQVFFVRDNGAGFDMRYVDKLFGVFQRLHGPAEFEGTGIGLANVRRIITRHGGRTWAEGRVGAGATFSFSLPDQPAQT